MWLKRGHLQIAERLRITTQRLVSVIVDTEVISTSWWPVRIPEHKKISSLDSSKVLCMWLNSSLGLLIMLANRVSTAGPWGKYKKPTLLNMPVLDPRKLGKRAVRTLVEGFNHFGEQPLGQLASLDSDMTRVSIDECLSSTLGIPNFQILRKLLADEPWLQKTTRSKKAIVQETLE